MYNINAFLGNASDSWNWDYGDASPLDNVVNGSHQYAANGTYSVTLTDSMFGWRMLCADTQTGSVTIGSGGSGCAGNCGQDSLNYSLAKATAINGLNINNATSAQAICQYFNAPQPITVSGMSFPANSATNSSITVTCALYLAGTDSMPTGSPLASAHRGPGHQSMFGGNIGLLEKHVSWTPVTMTQPYVVVMSNLSPNSVTIYTNDYGGTPADGLGEWLSSVDLFGTWFRGYNVNVGRNSF